jgi:regulator of sigma E protease
MPDFARIAIDAVAFMLVADLLILCHELGHYLAARASGTTPTRFSVGFGPALIETTGRDGTVWRLSAIPLGGYVAFGDFAGHAGILTPPPLIRLWIAAAGPIANIVAATVLLSAIAYAEPARLPVATIIAPLSPAAAAGFQPGDVIDTIDGKPIRTFDQLASFVGTHPKAETSFGISRDGQPLTLALVLGTEVAANGQTGYLGIESRAFGKVPGSIWQAVGRGCQNSWRIARDVLTSFAGIFAHDGTRHVSGFLGTANLAGKAAIAGTSALLSFAAILSINLALMNLLPIPLLDGGVCLLCLVEWLRGKPASPRFHGAATALSLAAFAGLFVTATLHDLASFGLFHWV